MTKATNNSLKESPKAKAKGQGNIKIIEGGIQRTVTKKTWREIKRLQTTSHLLIPKLAFQRLVREIMQQFATDFMIQSNALMALQEAAETKIVELFEDSNLISNNARRKTILVKDMATLLRVTKAYDYIQ